MSKRVSHSLIDPLLMPVVPRLYRALHVPRWFPPEGIIAVGHVLAIAAAFGFALSPRYWWGGVLVAAGVAGNHLADMVDGTHARSTGQCRNGGELLDHFTDPLSFSYWFVGLGIACDRLDLAIVGILVIYATAVLTNIKAKMIGEFTLARFGPTEFKTLLVIYGVGIAIVAGVAPRAVTTQVNLVFLSILAAVGVIQLVVNLILAVVQVNRAGATPPDTSDWVITGSRAADDSPADEAAAPR
ncbi:MAG: CDP-alcohol phosphatidyltransferase family protein [Phycisphaerales bacterium]|nr:CDP-alcohol phosphatidyltransferase family protein [Phycisphaerales bacterium]